MPEFSFEVQFNAEEEAIQAAKDDIAMIMGDQAGLEVTKVVYEDCDKADQFWTATVVGDRAEEFKQRYMKWLYPEGEG